MPYTHEMDNALTAVPETRYNELLGQARAATAHLRVCKKNTTIPVLSVPEREDDLPPIEEAARHIAAFKTFVVVGMGGSCYGGKALCALAQNPFAHGGGTTVRFIDNIDPLSSDRSLMCFDFKTTMFALVSKSGDTAETLAHALILLEEAKDRLGTQALRDHFIVITEPRDSALSRLAKTYGLKTLDHDPGIGGRFSSLTAVGLLPAQVAGVNIRAIRKGAAEVVRAALGAEDSAPAQGAALSVALMQQGRSLSVLMPYCDRLEAFTVWYCQLWAESLGKDGKGGTPVRSLGACDQHSQLQLYLDGPRDKFLTFILLDQASKGASMPNVTDPALSYLSGRTLGDLMDAEQRATLQTLVRNQCPVRVFRLGQLNEEAMGALMMHFMLETMIAGELLGVNTFDQPAVEQGKILAREYLTGRK